MASAVERQRKLLNQDQSQEHEAAQPCCKQTMLEQVKYNPFTSASGDSLLQGLYVIDACSSTNEDELRAKTPGDKN